APPARRRPKASAIETPTTKRKKGKIVSVYVQPFHSAWSSGGETAAHVPGSLTTIIPATATPRRTSTASKPAGAARAAPTRGGTRRSELWGRTRSARLPDHRGTREARRRRRRRRRRGRRRCARPGQAVGLLSADPRVVDAHPLEVDDRDDVGVRRRHE